MCAALELNEKLLRPGRLLACWRADQPLAFVWAGFAQSEKLAWWRQQGGALVDIPAERFAERSLVDRLLRWDDLPAGAVVRGVVLESSPGTSILKVVTRASDEAELARFAHPRMPLLEEPLFHLEPIAFAEPPPAQAELFA